MAIAKLTYNMENLEAYVSPLACHDAAHDVPPLRCEHVPLLRRRSSNARRMDQLRDDGDDDDGRAQQPTEMQQNHRPCAPLLRFVVVVVVVHHTIFADSRLFRFSALFYLYGLARTIIYPRV